MKYINDKKEIVTLTDKRQTNKYGHILLWVKCENGYTVSIFEDEFYKQFKLI